MQYPRTKEGYQVYLQSPHWQELRRYVLERDNHRCKHCGRNTNLQVHHKFYRDNWEDSIPDDLETLCRDCHRQQHPELVVNVTVNVVQNTGCPFSTFKELQSARSRHEITRAEFKQWAQSLMKRGRKARRHKSKPTKRHRRRAKAYTHQWYHKQHLQQFGERPVWTGNGWVNPPP